MAALIGHDFNYVYKMCFRPDFKDCSIANITIPRAQTETFVWVAGTGDHCFSFKLFPHVL
jgi:hypothetical protein